MVRRMRALAREDEGTALVLVALALVVLLGFAAVTVDLGMMYLTKSRLQNALDGAVLAGAIKLAKGGDNAAALAEAQQYLVANGVSTSEATITPDMTTGIVDATATRPVQTFFARLLGMNVGSVTAVAQAKGGIATSLDEGVGAVPIGVLDGTIQPGVRTTLKYSADSKNSTAGTGWFSWLDLPIGNASDNERYLRDGYPGELWVGMSRPEGFLIETGNSPQAVVDAINQEITGRFYRCTHNPPCNQDHYVANCPRIIYIPVVRVYESDGVTPIPLGDTFHNSDNIKIVKFVEFIITEPANSTGNTKGEIYGYFLDGEGRDIVSGNSTPSNGNPNGTSALAVKLTR